MAANLSAIKRAQNKSKQAIVNSVAKEIEALAPLVDKAAKRLLEANANLGKCWQGTAYDNVRTLSTNTEQELRRISKSIKTVSSTIKTTGASVYPH